MCFADKCKYIAGMLLLIVIVSVASFRYKPINCALCENRIYLVSLSEYYLGAWSSVPTIHPVCQNYIIEVLAPNSDMDLSEWLAIRGKLDDTNLWKNNREIRNDVDEAFKQK